LVDDEPVQPELAHGFGELGKVHRLAHIAVGAEGVVLQHDAPEAVDAPQGGAQVMRDGVAEGFQFLVGGGELGCPQTRGQRQGDSGLLVPTAEFGIPHIAQSIAKEIEAQDGQTDGQTGENGEPGGLLHKGTPGAAEHQTPGRCRRLSPQA